MQQDQTKSHTPPEQLYDEMAKEASPASKSYQNVPIAFAVGGLICVLGEGVSQFARWLGVDAEFIGTVASVTLIFLASLLTGIGWYHTIAKYAGAGTLVPITGFSNAITSPALEFQSEGFILGVGAKMFVIAGPVLVYGISASVMYGVILWLLGLGG